MVEISPVCPPASVPCATTMSTPASAWRRAWSTVPASAATFTPFAWPCSIIQLGGGPRALAIRLIRCSKASSITSRCFS
jgi:hypothetical protein